MKTKRKLVPKSYPFTDDSNVVSSDAGHCVYDGNSTVSPKKQCLDGSSRISSPAIDVSFYGVRNITNISDDVVPSTYIGQPIAMLDRCDALPDTGNYPSVVAISAQPEYVVSNSINRSRGRRSRSQHNPPVTNGTLSVISAQPKYVVSNSSNRSQGRRSHSKHNPPITSGTSSATSAQPEYILSNFTNCSLGRRSHTKQNRPVTGGTSSEQPPLSGPPVEYKYLGNCTHTCQHCGALFWFEERLKNTPTGSLPRYNRCCRAGRVALHTYQIYPEYIKLLLRDRHCLENIKAYNQMFSMTSLGANIDESINNGRGPYVFKISGQLYHWIGSLCPADGEPPRFLQLYIYDTDNEVDNRLSHYGGDNSVLHRDIVEGLINLLDSHNALEYELPTRDMLGAIVYELGPESEMDYDMVLEAHEYSKDLKMIGSTNSSSKDKRFTMNEYLSGIYDAINRGDNDGSDCGSKLILPQSFTGGPRYMYSYYLDALAICRVHGNPSYFITFTCNVNWPEISEYMAQFSLLTTTDRAAIVDRVFEMKINQFINYLRDNEPFGKVVAVLYTVEFQKRGCTSFLRIRTVNNIVYPTCRVACEPLGLLQDDQEWEVTLQEAALTVTPAELRALLAHIFAYYDVSNPKKLWERRTAHSRFKIPLDLTNTSVCAIKKNTQLADLLKETCLIMWDESPMNDRRCFKTLDRTLRDILNQPAYLFGGKTVMLGDEYCIPNDDNAILNLINFIYDADTLRYPSAQKLQEKAIVCPKNDTAGIINDKILSLFTITTRTYLNHDDAIPHTHDGEEIELLGNIIQLALWHEMALTFNITEYEAMEKPVVIAVTSCWVRHFNGLQLSGTSATHYYLNPKIPETYHIKEQNTVKEMTTNFGKLDKFEGHDFRRWQNKMHFLLTTLKVVYVSTTPMSKLIEDDTVEAIRRRAKWENDDYICRGHILNGMSDSLFGIYQNVESAKKLCDSLESKYMVDDASSKKFLTGHFKRDCRSGKKNNTNAGGSGKGSKDQSQDQVDAIAWWIDSGAITNVCNDRCWFKIDEPVEDKSVLYMGDDHFSPIHGKGSVALEFSSRKTITLFNVLYIPNLRKNLVFSLLSH
uniref:ATP-dependent DNA helicase n=1 Tax=Tanacetum cinerariifolium TaxID=118510 RepID=A0A6L2LZI9_TANCI|nr:helitron helicase-like domain-containing protein [Tanacetum cinerariifolium]